MVEGVPTIPMLEKVQTYGEDCAIIQMYIYIYIYINIYIYMCV